MKLLFSDKALRFYKKVPSFVWVLIFAATIFLANAFELIDQSKYLAGEVSNIYLEAGVNVRAQGLVALVVIGSVFLYTLLFELLARWLAGDIVRRYGLKLNPAELIFMVRLVLSIINLVLALISLFYLVSENVYLIINASLEVPIITLILIWFYSAVREKIVPLRASLKLFSFFAKIYFGIYIILNGYNFINYMFIYDVVLSSYQIAVLSIKLGVVLIMAGVAYMYAVKLKKFESIVEIKDDKNDGDPFGFEIIVEEKKDDTVFKDFDI